MTTKTLNRNQLLDACERHWVPSAAKLYHLAGTQVEDHASGCEVFDSNNRRYIDFACSYGVFVVGHSHPKVHRAFVEQVDKMAWSAQGQPNVQQGKLSDKLCDIAPGNWGKVSYMLSGAEAVEQSLRYVLQRQSKRKRIVIVEGAYHGKTLAAMSLLGQSQHEKSFGKLSHQIVKVPYGDTTAMRKAIGDGACAVYLEPILGGAHLSMPPLGYLEDVRQLCTETNTILVADEIQTAFGRCGKMFAVDYGQISPDILILSKGLTGGFTSFACALYSRELLGQFQPDESFFTSTGGHPLGCATALAAIEVVEQEGLVAASLEKGNRLRFGLMKLAAQYPNIIEDVPGVGLMTGLRLKGAKYETLLSKSLSAKGVHAGHSMNEKATAPVLRFYPPLTVSDAIIDEVLQSTAEALAEISRLSTFTLSAVSMFTKNMYKLPLPLLKRAS
ncbi:aspartate aminotransferase family protein [Vibrio ostreicida]|uniref:Aminotransferase class III-fold pyridoxal phosphate-dependent enzyme n=1 Tax=Vibrio ostreicida TaxID=526588 RepID=A0ABT8BQZ6_9VIBR|nr:aminotransferase class III-fold pyridoxal phosphate-dependent enzyme [Vibrio ostreicida]MDN3608528.1 aminotransferase class III-fold pyridoxal phosphate-dependent enzyme [Vibrio ostreicida]NPD10661.1 aspartate aminotransferase family protein [Vibrio ostreicida]